MPDVTLFDPVPLFGDEPEERPAAWDLVGPAEPIEPPPHAVETAITRPEIEVRLSTRRRKTSEAKWVGGKIVVSLPAHLSLEARRKTTDWLVERLMTRAPAAIGARRRRVAGPGRHAERALPGRGPARLGALGHQPDGPLGLVLVVLRRHPHLAPAARRARLGARLRPGPRSGPPDPPQPLGGLPPPGRRVPAPRRGGAVPGRLRARALRDAPAPEAPREAQTGSSARILPRRRRLSLAPPRVSSICSVRRK